MTRKSKEVEGLLYKVAELETLLIVLIAMLDAKGLLTKEQIGNIFGVAEVPEILGARIKMIEEQGVSLMEARKKVLSERLGIASQPVSEEEEANIHGVVEDDVEGRGTSGGDPDRKLH